MLQMYVVTNVWQLTTLFANASNSAAHPEQNHLHTIACMPISQTQWCSLFIVYKYAFSHIYPQFWAAGRVVSGLGDVASLTSSIRSKHSLSQCSSILRSKNTGSVLQYSCLYFLLALYTSSSC